MCSATCIDFAAYDICAHTIAVAEVDGSLTEFVQCYKATNQRPPNVDALIHMDLPAGRGTKKTKSTQRRKGATNSNRRQKDVVESYAKTCERKGAEKELAAETTTTGTTMPTNKKGPQVHILYW